MTGFLDFLADDRNWWWWLTVAIPLAVLAWGWTAYVRKGQLSSWNLSTSPTAPGLTGHVVLVAVVLGLLPLGVFSILNWLTQYMTAHQFAVNFGCWFLGALVGIAGGVIGARAGAERELVQFPSTSIRRQ